MGKEVRAFVLLIASTFQAAFYIIGAFYFAPILEKSWPIPLGWEKVLLIVALSGIIHLYYVLFRFLLKNDNSKK